MNTIVISGTSYNIYLFFIHSLIIFQLIEPYYIFIDILQAVRANIYSRP